MVVTMGAVKGGFSLIKRQCIAIVCIIALMTGLSACAKNYLPGNESDIDAVFERDYSTIMDVTSYLLSLEENTVYINYNPIEVLGEFGKPLDISGGLGKPITFPSQTIKQLAVNLEDKGYNHITKKDNVVVFDVWRRLIGSEFDAGFVYSVDGSGDLSALQFLTYQRPLSKENWYYYEEDYNEWRNNRADA